MDSESQLTADRAEQCHFLTLGRGRFFPPCKQPDCRLYAAYTLPEAFTKKCSIQRARVYVSTQNLLTITSYSGYNPETSFKEDNVTAPGTDYGMYPLYRTCTFGINVTF